MREEPLQARNPPSAQTVNFFVVNTGAGRKTIMRLAVDKNF
jgi:hypothetical protein